MFVGIITKYVGPTNTKGSRIIATDRYGRRVTYNYNDAWSSTHNHLIAAIGAAEKGWPNLCRTLCSTADWKGGQSTHTFEIAKGI